MGIIGPRMIPSAGATKSAAAMLSSGQSLTPSRVASSFNPNAPATITTNTTPEWWYEKGAFWHLPDLLPAGAVDYTSIVPIEAARGYTPAQPSIYDGLPVCSADLPIFVGTVGENPGSPNNNPQVAAYRVWTTAATVPLAYMILKKLNFGIHGFSLNGGWAQGYKMAPAIPIGQLKMSRLGVSTPSGATTAAPPRYAYLNPTGSFNYGVAADDIGFTSIWANG